MDMKKYHDETLKKIEKMLDEEFCRVLRKGCGTNYELDESDSNTSGVKGCP